MEVKGKKKFNHKKGKWKKVIPFDQKSYTVAAQLRAEALMETQHFFSKGHST